MCGIIGIIGTPNASKYLYSGLKALQHRGQASAGIVTFSGEKFHMVKDAGLVKNVFDRERIEFLKGKLGIGHVRYPTIGSNLREDAQPFYTRYPGIAMAHNGNLTNFEKAKNFLLEKNFHMMSKCDVEVVLNIMSYELIKLIHSQEDKITNDRIFQAIKSTMEKISGAYSVVGLVKNKLFAFRDPLGIKPLIFGIKEENKITGQNMYGLASESLALTHLGFDLDSIQDIKPGHAIIIEENSIDDREVVKSERTAFCAFEYAYFAHSNSKLNGKSVSKCRSNIGEKLAEKFMKVPLVSYKIASVPDTSRTAAIAFAYRFDAKLAEDLIVKDRYADAGRTFIESNKEFREEMADGKYFYNPWRTEGELILIDDSLVRGTTMKRIVKKIKDVGYNKIHVRLTFPKICSPCVYGIDFQTKGELIGAFRTEEEIRQEVGADSLKYISIPDFCEAVEFKPEELCLACVTGKYPTNISEEDLKQMELSRCEELKK